MDARQGVLKLFRLIKWIDVLGHNVVYLIGGLYAQLVILVNEKRSKFVLVDPCKPLHYASLFKASCFFFFLVALLSFYHLQVWMLDCLTDSASYSSVALYKVLQACGDEQLVLLLRNQIFGDCCCLDAGLISIRLKFDFVGEDSF